MLYLTGDTHGNFRDNRIQWIQTLSEEDIVIVLGDFGFYWSNYHIEYWNTLDIKCTVLAVIGNHENFAILETLPESEYNGAKVRVINDKTLIFEHGQVCEIEGKKFFIFGGALSIDKNQRVPGESWWSQEQPSEQDYQTAIENLEKYNYDIDFFLAHDVPNDIAKRMFCYAHLIPSRTSDMLAKLEHQICMNGSHPYRYFFGHHHTACEYGEYIRYACLYTQVYNLTEEKYVFFRN